MNKETAMNVLKAYGKPTIKTATTVLVLARQDESCITQIESATDEELITEYKSLVWMNYIYNQVSLNELQRIDLIDLEIEERKLEDGLKEWFAQAEKDFWVNEANS